MAVRRVVAYDLDRAARAVEALDPIERTIVEKAGQAVLVLDFIWGNGMDWEDVLGLPDEAFFAASDLLIDADDAGYGSPYRPTTSIFQSMDPDTVQAAALAALDTPGRPDAAVAGGFV